MMPEALSEAAVEALIRETESLMSGRPSPPNIDDMKIAPDGEVPAVLHRPDDKKLRAFILRNRRAPTRQELFYLMNTPRDIAAEDLAVEAVEYALVHGRPLIHGRPALTTTDPTTDFVKPPHAPKE
jgi:hypothetical protein